MSWPSEIELSTMVEDIRYADNGDCSPATGKELAGWLRRALVRIRELEPLERAVMRGWLLVRRGDTRWVVKDFVYPNTNGYDTPVAAVLAAEESSRRRYDKAACGPNPPA